MHPAARLQFERVIDEYAKWRAIAEKERAYESFDVPKGTLRGSPPVPEDDLTTLRTSCRPMSRLRAR